MIEIGHPSCLVPASAVMRVSKMFTSRNPNKEYGLRFEVKGLKPIHEAYSTLDEAEDRFKLIQAELSYYLNMRPEVIEEAYIKMYNASQKPVAENANCH